MAVGLNAFVSTPCSRKATTLHGVSKQTRIILCDGPSTPASLQEQVYPMRTHGFALPFVISMCGCAVSLQEASSGPTGCAPEDISILESSNGLLSQTWLASCGGDDFRCSGSLRDTGIPFVFDVVGASCSPVRTAAHARVVQPPTPPPPPVVSGKDAQGRKTFKTAFRRGSFDLLFYGVPAVTSKLVALYVETPPAYAGKTCDIGFMVDGQLVPANTYSVKAQSNTRVKVVLKTETVSQMARAEFVSGRFCEAEWRLDAPAHKPLTEFVARFNEETAWLNKTSATAEANAGN